MKAKVNMQETLAEAATAIAKTQKVWRKNPEVAITELRFTRAMCLEAEAALKGVLEIEDK